MVHRRPFHPRSFRQHRAFIRPRPRRHRLSTAVSSPTTTTIRPHRHDSRPCRCRRRSCARPITAGQRGDELLSRRRPRPRTRLAGASARQYRGDPAGGRDRGRAAAGHARRAGSADPVHRLRRVRTGQRRLPPPWRRPSSARAGTRSAPSWRRPSTQVDYASLARCTQYAHFTPESIVRAIWAGLQRLGWRGGRVLEPGIGTGLFPALMPEALRDVSHVTGIELDPVTARIARLVQPERESSTRISRAPICRRISTSRSAIRRSPTAPCARDPAYRSLGLRLHDYFIARSIERLKPGGLAAFVTCTGTMDKADAPRARAHRQHGRSGRRDPPARRQLARRCRHRRRGRHPVLPQAQGRRGRGRRGLARPRGGPRRRREDERRHPRQPLVRASIPRWCWARMR